MYKVIQDLIDSGYILRLTPIGMVGRGFPPNIFVPACYVELARGKHIHFRNETRSISSERIHGDFRCFWGSPDIKSKMREKLDLFFENLIKNKN